VERLHAYGLSLSLLAAVAYPAFLEPYEDGYPLSTYPMFSNPRPRTVQVTRAIALGDGVAVAVPPAYVANSEAMQALQTLKKSVADGHRAQLRLCEHIVSRIQAAHDADFAGADRVELQTVTLDSIAYLGGQLEPLSSRTHVRCALERQ